MDPLAAAVLLSWNLDPWVIVPLVVTAAVYLRGWLSLRKKLSHRYHVFRPAAFLLGSTVVFVALCSPIDAFASLLLSVHMTQHILLTMVAPPLLLLGAPMLPLLRGVPRTVFSTVFRPALRAHALRRLGAFAVRPIVALTSFSIATVAWHVPVLYELALRSEFWHEIEHICFFLTGLLFWWPVVQPWPSRPHWSGWAMVLYLLAADLVNTALSAVLCFAERILYPSYAVSPELWGISALADQSSAGAIMWVTGSLAFLLPVGWILTRLLEPSLVKPPTRKKEAAMRASRPKGPRASATRSLLAPLLVLLSQLYPAGNALPHHGGVVQFKEATDPFVVTLFSESAPVHPGLVDLSVLVQRSNGEPVLDANVAIELVRQDQQGQPIRAVASRSQASNKLMYTARTRLPTAGVWDVTVRIRRDSITADANGRLVLEAAGPLEFTWLYSVVFGGLLVALWLSWRNRGARARSRQPCS